MSVSFRAWLALARARSLRLPPSLSLPAEAGSCRSIRLPLSPLDRRSDIPGECTLGSRRSREPERPEREKGPAGAPGEVGVSGRSEDFSDLPLTATAVSIEPLSLLTSHTLHITFLSLRLSSWRSSLVYDTPTRYRSSVVTPSCLPPYSHHSLLADDVHDDVGRRADVLRGAARGRSRVALRRPAPRAAALAGVAPRAPARSGRSGRGSGRRRKRRRSRAGVSCRGRRFPRPAAAGHRALLRAA